MRSYVRERALSRKYPDVESPRSSIELQDMFLSDRRLNSRSGSEREQTTVQTAQVVRDLGFAYPETFVRSTAGDLLVAIGEKTSILPFPNSGDSPNPFSKNPEFEIAAYFYVASSDWSMQAAVLEYFQSATRELSFYADVSESSPDLLRAAKATLPRSLANRDEHAWFDKQIGAADRFARRSSGLSGTTEQTLRRPIENLFLPRLEFMVDVGLLVKPDPSRFSFGLSENAAPVSALLRGGTEVIEGSYFGTLARVFKRKVATVSSEKLIEHFSSAYQLLRNDAGYASIRESAILANSISWHFEPWRIVEIADAFKTLTGLARGPNPRVRINSDRFRRPFTYRPIT